MAKYSKVLYDNIGRTYERKNLYLKEVALLQDKIREGSPKEKESLKTQLKELISKKNDHPYLKELKEYQHKEKRFLEDLKKKSAQHQASLEKGLSKDVEKLEHLLFESKAKMEFYKDYTGLTYDAEYFFKEATIHQKLIPNIIYNIKKLEEDLRKAENYHGEENKEAIGREIARFKSEQNAVYEKRLSELKEKRREGLISEKALKNGKKELKKNYQYAVRVKEYEDPDKMKRELIKSKKFELKDYTKVQKRVLNADVADARRNTPTETMKTTPINTIAGALI
uniref:hypothetical protein n=1 Tax=Proteiniclasticum sp. TaxID=2053595 RepID=UPI00289B1A55